MNSRAYVVALGSGLLFGAGLAVSGLTRPEVVLGFLDVTGAWDPTLGVVMLVATAVNAALVALAMRRRRPLWGERFSLAPPGRIDRRLLAGAGVFGVGWGLAGVCPGPALASLASATPSVVTFVAAMATGLLLVDALPRMRRAPAPRGQPAGVCEPTRETCSRPTAPAQGVERKGVPMRARVSMLVASLLLGSALTAHAVTLSTPVIQGKDVIACIALPGTAN
jgi:hypothetical protein